MVGTGEVRHAAVDCAGHVVKSFPTTGPCVEI